MHLMEWIALLIWGVIALFLILICAFLVAAIKFVVVNCIQG